MTSLAASRSLYVEGPENAFQSQFEQALLEQLPDWQLASPEQAGVWLALGDAAFERALQQRRPVLGVLISRRFSEQQDARQCRCSAIWRGAPVEQQLALIEVQMPLARRVAVMLGEHSAWQPEDVPKRYGNLAVELVELGSDAELGHRLRETLPGIDALLLPSDSQLFPAENAKLILLTGYRLGTPVFGPNASYVVAGSAATRYPSGADLVAATVRQLRSYAGNGHWFAPDFSGQQTVAVNSHVASSFQLRFRDQHALEQALEQSLEKAP